MMDYEGSQVDLFVAVLVRFPQISAMHYEPETSALRMAFMLKKGLQDFADFVPRFDSHLALFHVLRQDKVSVAAVKHTEIGKFTTIEVTRDLASLSLGELNLIVELVTDYYGDAVVQEEQGMAEEDLLEQDFLIDALLMSSSWRFRERLTGFRENGRVLVYSVPLGVSES